MKSRGWHVTRRIWNTGWEALLNKIDRLEDAGIGYKIILKYLLREIWCGDKNWIEVVQNRASLKVYDPSDFMTVDSAPYKQLFNENVFVYLVISSVVDDLTSPEFPFRP
jgi:hypothetical protein